jgi:hypothetical protein
MWLELSTRPHETVAGASFACLGLTLASKSDATGLPVVVLEIDQVIVKLPSTSLIVTLDFESRSGFSCLHQSDVFAFGATPLSK